MDKTMESGDILWTTSVTMERRNDSYYRMSFLAGAPLKITIFFSVSKFWHSELFWWDLLCNLTLRTFRGAPVKNKTHCIYTLVSRHMSDRYEELTERFSQPLPERFILKLLLIRLTKVEICHLNRSYFRHLLFLWAVVERTMISGKEQQYEPPQLICSCSARARQRQRWWGQPQQCWGWEWWSREQR